MHTAQTTARSQIKFGTDGWRAITADQFTFANVEKVARAYSQVILSGAHRRGPVLVGFDNRFLAASFALRTAKVLAAEGLDPQIFSSPIPTPLLSFAVRHLKGLGGIMITASHNSAIYSGFKVKEPAGCSAFEQTTAAIEEKLAMLTDEWQSVEHHQSEIPVVDESRVNRAYQAHIEAQIDCDHIRKHPLSVIVDSMHGTGGQWIENLLSSTKARVMTIRDQPDCLFGGVAPEPIDKNLGMLKEAVRAQQSNVGIATDGDADRLGVVSDAGETMTMHDIAPMLLLHLLREKNASGSVVATVSQSILLKRIAAAFNLPFVETPVGFKYIAKEMLEGDVLIGAEESGGIGIKGHLPERDGIFNGLLLLEALVAQDKTPTQLLESIRREFGSFFYARRDLHLPVASGTKLVERLSKQPPANIAGKKIANVNAVDGVKLIFEDDCWLMLRQSGTEPVLRIYAEARSKQESEDLLSAGEAIAMS